MPGPCVPDATHGPDERHPERHPGCHPGKRTLAPGMMRDARTSPSPIRRALGARVLSPSSPRPSRFRQLSYEPPQFSVVHKQPVRRAGSSPPVYRLTMPRFLHGADWQLGMTRHFLEGEAQARFTAARIEVIGTIGALARRCDGGRALDTLIGDDSLATIVHTSVTRSPISNASSCKLWASGSANTSRRNSSWRRLPCCPTVP
jgi:hypothetical protein